MVGQEKLHDKALCVAAGNLLSDKAVVNNMSTAMQSRLIHINMGVDKNKWIDWAIGNGIDNRIISFIEYQPSYLHKFDPAHQDDTFACQRTWEFCSRLIKPYPNVSYTKLPLIAGTVSEGVAREFLAFCELSSGLVTFPEVLANPTEASVPSDAGSLYATVGMLADNLTLENAATVMEYLVRLPIEFQLCTLRRVIKTLPKIISIPTVREWLRTNAKEWLN